tara:strand:+ start:104 stop:937 length:834 start_codon:yes stop_codon:yes gene_type:complete
MLEPPVFKSQEEADAYLDAQKDTFGGGAVGVAEGLGLVDLFAGVPWLMTQEYSQQALDSLLAQQERLDPKEYDRLRRLRMTSQGLLGDEISREKANKRINVSKSKTYDEAIENTLENLGYNKTEKSEVARQVAFLTTLGVDLAFLTKVIVQNAPRGIEAIRNALKNMGKNVDEADQAVMKAEMETGISQTPVQMEMDLAAPKAKPVQNTQEQVYNLETRLYELNNLLRQEGGSMSKTNFQKLNALIDKTQSKLNKLKGYKNGGIVQNSVDYALEQWT